MCMFVYPSLQKRLRSFLTTQGSLVLPFYNLPLASLPLPDLWQPLVCPPSQQFCHFMNAT